MSTVQATNVTCPHRGRTNRVPAAAEGRPRHALLQVVALMLAGRAGGSSWVA